MLSLHQPFRQFRKADAMCKEAEAKAEHCPLMQWKKGGPGCLGDVFGRKSYPPGKPSALFLRQ